MLFWCHFPSSHAAIALDLRETLWNMGGLMQIVCCCLLKCVGSMIQIFESLLCDFDFIKCLEILAAILGM